MDCDDATLLVAAADLHTLDSVDSARLHEHAAGCTDCRELIGGDGDDARWRWIVSVPEDALDDRDLLVLPLVDPSVFISDRELARGGMGRITRARDRRLGRDVAIKEVIAGGMRARFEREVMITAQLQHPAIIPIYEAGAWPDGSAFYTMRLVSGGTLGDAIDKATTLEARLALLPHVIALTEALAYAHSRRIVHRDLKPGNVLVGEFGETVVIDWGLAKDLATDLAMDADATPTQAAGPAAKAAPAAPRAVELTIDGSVMGTPGFMSPEQAAGGDVDERTDVYALGAILYNLLAGHASYLDQLTVKTARALMDAARDQPPTALPVLVPRAPRDLCAIVDRAMARDPGARFPTAKDMADELRRFQAGQLLRSRAYRPAELVARWIRRHRAAVAVGTGAVIVLAVVAGTSVREIVRRKDEAELALAHSRLERGRQLLVDGDPAGAMPDLAAAVAGLPGDDVARRLATIALRDAGRHLATFHGTDAAFRPDGGELAIGHDDGSVELVDAATGAPVRTLPALGGRITHLEYTPRGDALLAASPAGASIRDLRTGVAVALSSDRVTDARLVASAEGSLAVLATPSAVRVVRLDGSVVAGDVAPGAGSLDVAADGSLVLARTTEHVIAWSLPELTRVAVLPPATYARFDDAGGIVTADRDGLRRVTIAAPTAAPVLLRAGETQPIARLAGGTLAIGAELIDVLGATTHVLSPALSAADIASLDRTHVVTGGFDRAIRIWDLERPSRPLAILAAAEGTSDFAVAPGAARAASIGRAGAVELWDTGHLREPATVARLGTDIGRLVGAGSGGRLAAWLHGADNRVAILGPAGEQVAVVAGWLVGFIGADEVAVDDGGQLVIYSARDGSRRRIVADAASIRAAAVSPSAALLATSAAGRITLRDAHTGDARGGIDTHRSDITTIALDDAGHVVTGHEDGTVQIWDAATGAATATLAGHAAHVEELAIRGDRLVTTSWDLTVRSWAFPSGAPLGVVLGSAGGPIALSPDGRTVVTVDGAVIDVWDAVDGRLLEQLPAAGPLDAAGFVDDGHLAVGGRDGTLEIVDLAEPARSDDDIARLAASAPR